MKILALSDVRIHNWSDIIDFLEQKKKQKDMIDLVLYGGDDLHRFLPLDDKTVIEQDFHLDFFRSHELNLSLREIYDLMKNEIKCSSIEELNNNKVKSLLTDTILLKLVEKNAELHKEGLDELYRRLIKFDFEEVLNHIKTPQLYIPKQDNLFILTIPEAFQDSFDRIQEFAEFYREDIERIYEKSEKLISELNKVKEREQDKFNLTFEEFLLHRNSEEREDSIRKKKIDLVEKIKELLNGVLIKLSYRIKLNAEFDNNIVFFDNDSEIDISLFDFLQIPYEIRYQRGRVSFRKKYLKTIDKLIRKLSFIENNTNIVSYQIEYFNEFFKQKVYILRKKSKEVVNEIKKLTRYGLAAVRGNDDDIISLKRMEVNGVHNLNEEFLKFDNLVIIGIEGTEDRGLDKYSLQREKIRSITSQIDSTNESGILDKKPIKIGIGSTVLEYKDVKKQLESFIDEINNLNGNQKILLVTHSPPLGTLDLGHRFGGNHIGSIAVREFIERNHNRISGVICGHVHSWGGNMIKYRKVPIYNVSSHDKRNRNNLPPLNAYILEFDKQGKITKEENIDILNLGEKQNQNLPVSSISNIGAKRQYLLEEAGIRTIEDLANIDYNLLLDKLAKTCIRLEKQLQWKIFHKAYWGARFELGLIDKPIKMGEIEHNKENSIILDIETELVQHNMEQNFEDTAIWMIGVFSINEGELKQFYLGDYANIREMLIDFLSWIKKKQIETIYVYSSSRFDENLINSNLDKHIFGNRKSMPKVFLPFRNISKRSEIKDEDFRLLVPKDFTSNPIFINLYAKWQENLCLPSYKLANISKMILQKGENITGFNCGQIGSHLIQKCEEGYGILDCKYCKGLVLKVLKKNEEDVVYLGKLMEFFDNLEITKYHNLLKDRRKKQTHKICSKLPVENECITYENGMKNSYYGENPKLKEYICFNIVDAISNLGKNFIDKSSSFKENHKIQITLNFSDIFLKKCQINYFFNIGRIRIKKDINKHKYQKIGVDIIKLTIEQLNELHKLITEFKKNLESDS